MRILHCCLSNYYADNYNYQENLLSRQNKIDGHEVFILASTETFIDNQVSYTEPKSYINEDQIPVKRIEYKLPLVPFFIKKKVRRYKSIEHIKEVNPDIIFFHGSSAYELKIISKYAKEERKTLFVDSHQDFNNSARSFLSKNLLHKLFYKKILKSSLPNIDKLFYISSETKSFLTDFYNVPSEKLEFLPLGGIVKDEEIILSTRKHIRETLNLNEQDLMFIHTGRMNNNKKTLDIVETFHFFENPHYKLILIGTLSEDIQKKVLRMIEIDNRIVYLGWKETEELYEYLCAADIYLQPGSQSITMQQAICCQCAVVLYPYPSHEVFLQKNGVYVKNKNDILEMLNLFQSNSEVIDEMKRNSWDIAKSMLSYRKIADKIYQLTGGK